MTKDVQIVIGVVVGIILLTVGPALGEMFGCWLTDFASWIRSKRN